MPNNGITRHDVPLLEFESRFESGNLHRAIQVHTHSSIVSICATEVIVRM
jgi:hypothetical protein